MICEGTLSWRPSTTTLPETHVPPDDSSTKLVGEMLQLFLVKNGACSPQPYPTIFTCYSYMIHFYVLQICHLSNCQASGEWLTANSNRFARIRETSTSHGSPKRFTRGTQFELHGQVFLLFTFIKINYFGKLQEEINFSRERRLCIKPFHSSDMRPCPFLLPGAFCESEGLDR